MSSVMQHASFSENINSCIDSIQDALKRSECVDNIRGTGCQTAHTWQLGQTGSSTCAECIASCECDCDELSLATAKSPFLRANTSLRAVAQFCFDNEPPCQYEIIDIQACPDSGHIMHPPDPCQKYERKPRYSLHSLHFLFLRLTCTSYL